MAKLKHSNSISLVKYKRYAIELLENKDLWIEVDGINNWLSYITFRKKFLASIDMTEAARQRESESNRNANKKRIGENGKFESLDEKIFKGKERIMQRTLNLDKRIVKDEPKYPRYIRLAEKPKKRKPKYNLLENITQHIKENKKVEIEEIYKVFLSKVNVGNCEKADIKKIKYQKIDNCIRKMRNKGCIDVDKDVCYYIKDISFSDNIKNKKKKK